MKLRELYENPDNPSKATQDQLERLEGKLKRVPLGLTAMRIAYVTDQEPGRKMVISGNKRLRALRSLYGNDADLPDEWFQDVTSMSEAQRHEFIVAANVSDGSWDLDRLIKQYQPSEFEDLGIGYLLAKIPYTDFDRVDGMFEELSALDGSEPEKTARTCVCPFCHREVEL